MTLNVLHPFTIGPLPCRTGPEETGLRKEVLTLEEGQIATVAVDGGQGLITPATGEVKADGGTVTHCHMTADWEDARVQSEAAETDTDRLAQQPGGHPASPGQLLVQQSLESGRHLRQSGLTRPSHRSVEFHVTDERRKL